MPAESAGLAEAFATDFTHKRSSSGVDRHVAGEVIVSIKHLQKGESGTCVESTNGLGLALEATIYLPQPFVNCVTTDNNPIFQDRKLRLN